MQSLVFFNKEGDNLNFSWRPGNERFEGDLIFHENSNDTFKTIGIYLFEKIPSFEYEVPGILKLEKFQLFNEYRFNFTGNSYFTQSVTEIELVNTDPNFYSKWICGLNFEKMYPVGTQIYFNNPIFEFTNSNQSYTVVSTKKNAVLIISNVNNSQFNNLYGSQLGLTSSYSNVTVSGLNSIGIYNYVDASLNDNLSPWSEPDFYSKYFNGKKLTVINTQKNNGVYTVNNIDVFDKTYNAYDFEVSSYTSSQNLAIELILKTDLPLVYTGPLVLSSNNISFQGPYPMVLKPGVEFTLPFSTLNTNSLVVDSISQFSGNVNLTYYATQSLVIYENKIYECIQAHTWNATSSITPSDSTYWQSATYLPLTSTVNTENFLNTEIHLTTNKLYFTYSFTQSAQVTFASTVEKYKNDFKFYNIDFYYEDLALHADLIYPSKYAEVNYYLFTQSNGNNYGTQSLGLNKVIYEQNVGVSEILKPEVNENINENFVYNIVFTDLDEYGLKIRINNQEYEEQIDFIYVGTQVSLPRTIDRTLRNWLTNNFSRLLSLGIIVNLQYIGGGSSIYYNSIRLRTEYPNVPLQFEVKVGTTADFYIQHSEVVFYDMSNYLDININGRSYGQTIPVPNGIPDIITGLSNWIDAHQSVLDDYGIYVSNINQMLIFKLKKQNQRLDYTIRVGKSPLPGVDFYKVINKINGNFGALIASNEIVLPEGGTYSFEDNPFATGQIVTINNTFYPYNNQEYNIIYLGQSELVLSYQGPFWGTSDPLCSVSPYVNIAFSGGFGATGCLPVITPTYSGSGQFNLIQFTQSFNLYNSSQNTYDISFLTLSGNSNVIDLVYLSISGNVYVFGDKISVIDAESSSLIGTINLPGNSSPIMMKYNSYNNYLYCLSVNKLYVIDPVIDQLVYTINLLYNASVIEINTSNGNVYVSYTNNPSVSIWSANNFTSSSTTSIIVTGYVLGMVYNESEDNLYFSQNGDRLVIVDGTSHNIVSSNFFSGINNTIYYEPINSAVYLFDDIGLVNFNNGTSSYINGIGTSSYSNLIFDYVNGDITISQVGSMYNYQLDGNLQDSFLLNGHGQMSVSPYDSFIYLSSQVANQILVINSGDGLINYTANVNGNVSKTIFNPERNSIIGIQPTLNQLVEVSTTLNLQSNINNPTYSNTFENMYGSLAEDYVEHPDLWLKTREYLRKPRINYNNEPYVDYVWKWETDEYPQMFLFDFSGSQLPITGSYAYVGPKPLTTISLNKNPNKDITKVDKPEFQQTIFNEISTTLEHVDSETDLSIIPEPLETFLGFRSDNEGPITSTLLLLERNSIEFTIIPTSVYNDFLNFKVIRDSINGDYGSITFNVNSTSVFTSDSSGIPRGLKVGQYIKVYIYDVTNQKNKYISINHGKTFKIRNVFTRQIIIDFVDIIGDESNVINGYPSSSSTTYMSVKFKVLDKEIGRFKVSGQTEIEDIRYKIELSNVGQIVAPDDVYIFKTYDINEQGIDWSFMNRKRKEMLMVRHDIYPYIGSYKSIINAINYFGYNDLELYEYYRNININSPDFFKLFKVEIPDIFDNNVPGWTVNDFIQHTMPNPNFEDTNLFNLTYKITDKEGNNVLLYSLPEVIIKLQGLKYWLQKNIIPITHRILDITGRADWVGTDTIVHRNYDCKILNVRQSMTPIDFSLNEAYLMPVNSGSTVYTCHIDFYTQNQTELPEYFTIKIRTYKTYKEWNPFTTYSIGEKVYYYGEIYENMLVSSKLKNPRKYEKTPKWNEVTDYQLGQFVKYNELVYQYIGTQSSFTIAGTSSNLITPYYDVITNGAFSNWNDNTEWKRIDWEPVQSLSEYRTGTHSYNFTIDSNIDPFVVIEVTSDNGYGQYYTSKKNYEIRGLNDLFTGYQGDKIGPFEPIIQITSPFITNPQ